MVSALAPLTPPSPDPPDAPPPEHGDAPVVAGRASVQYPRLLLYVAPFQ